jgi:hypothetical protein
MLPYQQRVIDEKKSLDEKLVKLKDFMDTQEYRQLLEAEQNRMFKQSLVMKEYSDILRARIAYFTTLDTNPKD